jgi:monoamine oxidase
MARSALFAALRRIANKSLARTTCGPDVQTAGATRRQFLGATLGAVALMPLVQACGDNGSGPDATIAIIGGGIAGLTCAYQLHQAGVRATVYEATGRVGGRMFSVRDKAPNGQVFELGGELIDSGHTVIQALAKKFNLQLDDLPAATDGLTQDVFFFDGRTLTDTEIVDAFTPVAMKIQAAIAATDASKTEYARIDALNIPQWLEGEAGLLPSSLIRRLLETSYIEEFGLEVKEQSAFNLLTLIDSETPDPFRVFGDSDERYHIHQGNDAVTSALAAALPDQIELGHRLIAVHQSDEKYTLTFATMDGEVTVVADHVVYALPFTVLREVELTDSGLSEEKRTVIRELGYGRNAKLMLQFSSRPWRNAPWSSSGSSISDVGALQATWETSRGQAGASGILTNFVGGLRGESMGMGSAEQRANEVLPWIEEIYPGVKAAYIANSAVRQHWPSVATAKGSYASYRPGQWTKFFGTEGVRDGASHFCGEHTSQDFQGYMEGGAETGALVAAEILDDLGIAKPADLGRVLQAKLRVPQACYRAGTAAQMTWHQRRQQLRR